MFTLNGYDFANHVLSDVRPINDPAWECMESVVISWIFGTITSELQDITKERNITQALVHRE
jgi:hypothetical protein